MTVGQTFQRYELKYMLTKEQYEEFLVELKKYMTLDCYGRTTIQSVYYDTPNDQIIRNSIDKPKYKEKIRLRSYGLANENTTCFLEIKRKCNGLVYKRRITCKEQDSKFFVNKNQIPGDGQIARELRYTKSLYETLEPKMLIIYERESYARENSEVRVTFDFNPRYRVEDINLHTSLEGNKLLPNGEVLMEIKVLHNMPLWLVHALSKCNVRRKSFSKYGTAYKIEKSKHQNYKLERGENKLWNTYSIQYSMIH